MHHWQLQEAKARFSELVKLAEHEGPQHITVRGEPAAVVLSATEYHKLTQPHASLTDFLNRSPLKGVALNLQRNKTKTRDIDL